MRLVRLFILPLCCVLLLCGVPLNAQVALEEAPTIQPTVLNTGTTALDDYMALPDKTYSWKLISKTAGQGATSYIIDMKSQTWLTNDEVDRTVWQHWVTIVKPDTATAKTALMFINGGANGEAPPRGPDRQMVQLARATNSVVASVGMIPNQPLTFHGDGVPRKEDDLIGYTWDQYLKTGDELWPARLPMTKAVVRAMDTVEAVSKEAGWNGTEIEDFVVAGGSKRGWTTWTVGAVDKRVKAIAPIVIDVLNANVSMNHHYAAYGFWAPAIGDYVSHKIVHRRFWPKYRELLQLVDPFAYRDRLTMPKCIINSTGDQFFLPDSSRFYFDDLLGEKHLCYVPNGEHSLKGTDALESLASFHFSIVNEIPRPEFTWELPDDNSIQVTAKTKPAKVFLWQATNPTARDFRTDTIGRAYKQTELQPAADGTYSVHVDDPDKGWTAYFVQLVFDVGAPTPMRLTTPVRVVPDVLPFADKIAPTLDEPK